MLLRSEHTSGAGRVLHGARGGYTLVEMMVAAAVSILIMVILTGAFQSGLDTFRKLRVQGNSMERLRSARTTLGDDLASPHFRATANGESPLDYVSGQDLTKFQSSWTPPSEGFFRIWQGPDPDSGLPFLPEGTDNGNLLFARARTHGLHFTVRRRGAGPEHVFRTTDIVRPVGATVFPTNFIDPVDYREPVAVPRPAYISQWAEVAWFVAPNGTSANGLPLFNLYRRQKLVVPNPGGNVSGGNIVVGTSAAGFAPPQSYNPEISYRTQFDGATLPSFQYIYNRTGSMDQPRNRFGMLPAHNVQQTNPGAAINGVDMQNYAGLPVTGTFLKPFPTMIDDLNSFNNTVQEHALRDSDDLVLSDVISFEIKVLWDGFPAASPTYLINGQTVINRDYPFDYLPQIPAPRPVSANEPFGFMGNEILRALNVRVFDTWSDDAAGNPTTPTGVSLYGFIENPSAAPGDPRLLRNWRRTDNAPTTTNPLVTAARLPLPIKVKAVLIRIRIWDAKGEQARQMTFMQDI